MFNLKALAGQIGAGLVRTVVPLVVAFVLNLTVVQKLGIDEATVENAVTLVIAAIYWLAVRVIEVYVAPRAGWLLGSKSTPVYGTPSDDGKAIVITSAK